MNHAIKNPKDREIEIEIEYLEHIERLIAEKETFKLVDIVIANDLVLMSLSTFERLASDNVHSGTSPLAAEDYSN